jgi:hypothetical protein
MKPNKNDWLFLIILVAFSVVTLVVSFFKDYITNPVYMIAFTVGVLTFVGTLLLPGQRRSSGKAMASGIVGVISLFALMRIIGKQVGDLIMYGFVAGVIVGCAIIFLNRLLIER